MDPRLPPVPEEGTPEAEPGAAQPVEPEPDDEASDAGEGPDPRLKIDFF
jgi:hypothetical protein